MNYYEAIRVQVERLPRNQSWEIWSITQTDKLRFVKRGDNEVLQQEFVVKWKSKSGERHLGFGHYSEWDADSCWLDVPTVQESEK